MNDERVPINLYNSILAIMIRKLIERNLLKITNRI